jgi:hypothetical protein
MESNDIDNIIELATIMVKNYLEIYILYNIKQINRKMTSEDNSAGKLIISGGAALEKYFIGIPEFITSDFDLKFTYPVNLSLNIQKQRIKNDMITIINYFNNNINTYFAEFNFQLFNEKFPMLRLIQIEPGIYISRKEKGKLSVYFIRIKYGPKTEDFKDIGIIDLIGVLPDDPKYYHYNVFTGKGTHNDILSRNADLRRAEKEKVYYIPIKIIDDIPYAGLGYIIWDTWRMINTSIMYDLDKITRYSKKFNAIMDGLNSLDYTASCDAFGSLVSTCQTKIEKCNINKDNMIIVAVEKGFLPGNPETQKQILDEFGHSYLCDHIRRINHLYI